MDYKLLRRCYFTGIRNHFCVDPSGCLGILNILDLRSHRPQKIPSPARLLADRHQQTVWSCPCQQPVSWTEVWSI